LLSCRDRSQLKRASLSQRGEGLGSAPARGRFGCDESKACCPTVSLEVILEVARAESAVLLVSLGLFEPGASKAHGQSTTHSQDPRGPSAAHPAAVFIQGVVQSIVQSGLNGPISSPAVEHAVGIQLFFTGAADQITGFLDPAATAPHAAAQSTNLRGGGEAHFIRGDTLGLQGAHFAPGAIVLSAHRSVLGRGPRGKKAAVAAWLPSFGRVFPGSF